MPRNDDSFREFFSGCARELSRAAFFLTGDAYAAEELLQDALVKTAMRWNHVRASASPEAYVRRIMLNSVRSRWRRRQLVAEYPTASIDDRPSSQDVEADALDRHEMAACLRALAPRQRAVLYVRFYLDLSEIETARLLGCSLGTVKSQTHDALKRLRAKAAEVLETELSEAARE